MSAVWSALSYGRDSLKAVIKGSVAPRREVRTAIEVGKVPVKRPPHNLVVAAIENNNCKYWTRCGVLCI